MSGKTLDPKKMTDAQRTEEICAILAQGLLRPNVNPEDKEIPKPSRSKNKSDKA